jgi:hypothetical protein
VHAFAIEPRLFLLVPFRLSRVGFYVILATVVTTIVAEGRKRNSEILLYAINASIIIRKLQRTPSVDCVFAPLATGTPWSKRLASCSKPVWPAPILSRKISEKPSVGASLL